MNGKGVNSDPRVTSRVQGLVSEDINSPYLLNTGPDLCLSGIFIKAIELTIYGGIYVSCGRQTNQNFVTRVSDWWRRVAHHVALQQVTDGIEQTMLLLARNSSLITRDERIVKDGRTN